MGNGRRFLKRTFYIKLKLERINLQFSNKLPINDDLQYNL